MREKTIIGEESKGRSNRAWIIRSLAHEISSETERNPFIDPFVWRNRKERIVNRGKDRRRHTLTSPPHTLSRWHENHCADAVNVYVCTCARTCISLSIRTWQKKEQTLNYLTFANGKRESDVLLNHTHETWNAEERPTVITPKICSLLTISKEKHKVRTRKENSAEVREEAKRTRKWKKSTHESTALYPVVI